ncbi:hypothetical protein JCM19294_583 [Nonlabens tegetincola]|uniref:Uncharacterized protein n=1 Tax=Nonlabens tegetincola TaxID=323273 RepID=A0A090Q4F9_9FLAO|nr:hypothetical protein [Nonlabens tegetincola]MEE2802466.1 hypothetical protein [Bacteroidota bacterium]GAK97077.1 hypothetical protein JCM19294_583 [Nonlabens tegetincola]
MKQFLLIFLIAISYSVTGQVGIGTATPVTDLQVEASTSLGPGEFNGIMVPRVSNIPSPAAPAGTIIYLDTVDGSNPIGFYFSNGSAYQNVTDLSSGTAAFFDSGTTTNATATTSEIFRSGRTRFGNDGVPASVVSIENQGALASEDRTTLSITNRHSSSALSSNTFSINVNNTSSARGNKVGINNEISSSGDGTHIGLNNLTEINSSSSATSYGINNNIDTGSTSAGTIYGIRTVSGNSTSTGVRYGIYSQAINDGSNNAYSGYFSGDRFAIRNEADTDGYELPTVDGSAGQVLTTDGSGNASWGNPIATNTSLNLASYSGGPSGSATPIDNGSYLNLSPTTGNQEFLLPEPTTVPGRMYILRNISNSENAVIYTPNPGGEFYASNSSSSAGFNITMDANSNTKTIYVISDGMNWTFGSYGF